MITPTLDIAAKTLQVCAHKLSTLDNIKKNVQKLQEAALDYAAALILHTLNHSNSAQMAVETIMKAKALL